MLEMPAWVVAVIIAVVLWEFAIIARLVSRVKKLRKIIRKLEYPGFEEEEPEEKAGGTE